MTAAQQNGLKKIFAPGTTADTHQAAQYQKGTLTLSDLDADPLAQFHAWFTHAVSTARVPQAEATTLSTAALPSGRVSARIVYLKELDGRGFVVYSDWAHSRKAADVRANPWASLTFWWRELERQVRVEGRVERLSAAESQAYFSTRARGSKMGAWASRQSEVLPGGGREALEARVEEQTRRWEGTPDEDIPVPEFWGGLRVVPDYIEFWQGRESRLHDRFRYTRVMPGDAGSTGGEDGKPEGEWTIERLNP